MPKLSKNQKLALGGGTFGLVSAALILFFIIRANKEPQEDKRAQDDENLPSNPVDLVETLFAGDENAQKWAKEGEFKVVDSPEFTAFFTASYSAGKKNQLEKVLKAASKVQIEQAKKFKAENKYAETEVALVNAAISKSLSSNLNSTLNASHILDCSNRFEELLSKVSAAGLTIATFIQFRCVESGQREHISLIGSHLNALREFCETTLDTRDEYALFVRLVECMKVNGNTFLWDTSIANPLNIPSSASGN